MANTIVEILADEGQTLSLELFPLGSDAPANGAGDALVEATNRAGLYEAVVAEALEGWHHAHVFVAGTGGALVLAGYVHLADDEAVHRVHAGGWPDVAAIGGNAAAAEKLALGADAMAIGTVSDAVVEPTATVLAAADITEAAADHWIGRLIVFVSGSLRRQVAEIVDYELAAGEGRFTVSALTEAPVDGDVFIIV